MVIEYQGLLTVVNAAQGEEGIIGEFTELHDRELIKQIILMVEFEDKSIRGLRGHLSVPMRNVLLEHKVITRNTKTINVNMYGVFRSVDGKLQRVHAVKARNGQGRIIVDIVITPKLKEAVFN